MARCIRWYAPGVRFYEIVTKCVGDQMLMRPDRRAVFLMAQALAGACTAYPVIGVIAFCFVSNHMHLVVTIARDEDGPLVSDFMKAVDERIAMSLNRHRARRGHFFQGRPSITPILDDAHVAARMTYVHAQPVHHDLVERAEEWPGLSSFRAVCDGRACVEVAYLDEVAWREAGGRAKQIANFTETVSVPLTIPAKWASLGERELRDTRNAHEQSVRDREREKLAERTAAGNRRRLPNGRRYETVDPNSRPSRPSERRPRPWAHASADAAVRFGEGYCVMLERYRLASARFRSSGELCPFPVGTRPPWVRTAPHAA